MFSKLISMQVLYHLAIQPVPLDRKFVLFSCQPKATLEQTKCQTNPPPNSVTNRNPKSLKKYKKLSNSKLFFILPIHLEVTKWRHLSRAAVRLKFLIAINHAIKKINRD